MEKKKKSVSVEPRSWPEAFLGSFLPKIYTPGYSKEESGSPGPKSGSRRSAASQEIRQWGWKPPDQTREVPKPEKQKMHTGANEIKEGLNEVWCRVDTSCV